MVVSYLRYVLLPLKAVGLNPSLEKGGGEGSPTAAQPL